MASTTLQPLLDGLDKIIEAFKRVDLQGATVLQNEVYGQMAEAVDAKSLSRNEIKAFESKNEKVWAAEEKANKDWAQERFGTHTSPASDEADEAHEKDSAEAPDEDTEPDGADWEAEMGPA